MNAIRWDRITTIACGLFLAFAALLAAVRASEVELPPFGLVDRSRLSEEVRELARLHQIDIGQARITMATIEANNSFCPSGVEVIFINSSSCVGGFCLTILQCKEKTNSAGRLIFPASEQRWLSATLYASGPTLSRVPRIRFNTPTGYLLIGIGPLGFELHLRE